jgi:fructoselysine-6-P-deglycase FrlB-like protein
MSDFVSSEIATQPGCWRRAATEADNAALPRTGERVAVVGCGTSWFIGMAYAALREDAGDGWTDAFAASEFPSSRNYDVIVAISRSGTTTEVAELLGAHSSGARVVAIVGVADSPVALAADHVITLDFADERSVVQTRFATTVLALLRASLGHDVEELARDAERALASAIPAAAVEAEQLTFLGRGWTIGLAHEAALKLREAAQSWTEAYPAMDYRHGPIAIAAPGRLVWMIGTPPPGLSSDVEATGALWLDSSLDPIAQLVLAQRVAVARAYRLGLDPDNPRNLTRSVILSV